MAVRKLIEIDVTDRADGKVPAWDAATSTHVYVDPSVAAPLSVPTVVAIGTAANGTGDVTPGLPSGHTENDILVLEVQSSNQDVSAPAGYSRMGPTVGIGTAAAAGATRLTKFWKRDGGSEVAPTVTDPGDHAYAVMYAIRGCPTTGDPFLSVGQTRKTTASTTGTAHAGATPVDACLVVTTFADALDSAAARYSSPTNADLSSVTEQHDGGTTDGTGGGICIITGTKAKAGSFAATTVTETSTVDVSSTFIFLPSGITGRAGFTDTQVFTTAGLADTWTKPTAANTVHGTLIAGGGSGGAGRNAATAAGGGGGGGGHRSEFLVPAGKLAATATVTAGAGGATTANVDGTAGNNGAPSTVVSGGVTITAPSLTVAAVGGSGATSGSGGVGGSGGGFGIAGSPGASAQYYGTQPPVGGTGGTTAAAGSNSWDFAGGGGAGGGTSQTASSGGNVRLGAGGGGGGRSNTNIGRGGPSSGAPTQPSSAGEAGQDSAFSTMGGGGGCGGNSASGNGGPGGWPGGGGGGGGSQASNVTGGRGGDGCVTIITHC